MWRWTENGWVLCCAEDGGDGTGGGGTNDNQDTQDGKGGNDGKTFTQEDVDRIITERLKRERKSWEQKAADDKRKAEMSEADKLKAAADEAEQKSKAAEERANATVVKAEAKVALLAAGVKSERMGYALKLIDLSGITVTDGEPDAAAITKQVDALLKDFPEIAGESKENAGGKEFSANDKTGKFNMNLAIRKMAGRA